ncbi:MAG: hypothetical protein RBS39_03335 [Phycisphaerales bacterium]|jgi:hypothetical protein|nr:hypothetical protein [Phycisphaerales bacterium]
MPASRPIYEFPALPGPIAPSHAPNGSTAPLAHWAGDAANLLSDAFHWPEVPADAPADTPLAMWSGWIPDPDDPSPTFRHASPLTWMPAARAALEQRLLDARRMGLALALRPHARHAISDVPGVLDLARRHEHARVLLDPLAMLTDDMLPRAADHLRRILSDLATLPTILAVVGGAHADLLALIDELVPPHVPLVRPAETAP